MVATRRTHTSSFLRLLESLKQIGRPASRPGVTTFGDPCERGSRALEIAQLAHDLRNQLTMVVACADEISRTAGFHNEQEIAQELQQLKAAKLLNGWRGAPAVDVTAVAQTAARLSAV